jgi:hypothetical protein
MSTQMLRRSYLLVSHNAKTLQSFAVLNSNEENFGRDSVAMIKATPAHAYRPEMLCFNFTLSYVQHLEEFDDDMVVKHTAVLHSLKIDEYFLVPEAEEAPDITDAPRALTALTMALSIFEVGLVDASKQVEFVEELLKTLTLPDAEHIKETMLQHVGLRKGYLRCEHSKYQSMLITTQAMVQMVSSAYCALYFFV